jgi:2-polyprenyl-6-methoxyphenol hydroxylase-like FAD-dependent oxidoreductase
VLCLAHRYYPDQGRDGWKRISEDKKQLHEQLRSAKAVPNSVSKIGDNVSSILSAIFESALENLDTESCYIWPYSRLAKLERWASATAGRVVIMGDAVHAIPPKGGKGANQAIEDAFTLSAALTLFESTAFNLLRFNSAVTENRMGMKKRSRSGRKFGKSGLRKSRN